MALAGKDASIYLAAGAGVPFVEESMTAVAGTGRTVYEIADTQLRYWDSSVYPDIEVDPDGISGYSDASETGVQYAGGRVTFSPGLGASALVRASGQALPFAEVGTAAEWSLDLDVEQADVSKFGDAWVNILPILKGGSASLSSWYVDETYFGYLGDTVILSLHTGSTTKRYEFEALLTKQSQAAAVDGIISDDLEFTITGPAYYR